MKRIAIKNWIGSQQIEVCSDEDMVMISQEGGSMSFLFFMTPEQARELAEDYESCGWDSLWWSARPDIEVHRWDVSDESRSYGM